MVPAMRSSSSAVTGACVTGIGERAADAGARAGGAQLEVLSSLPLPLPLLSRGTSVFTSLLAVSFAGPAAGASGGALCSIGVSLIIEYMLTSLSTDSESDGADGACGGSGIEPSEPAAATCIPVTAPLA